MSADDSLDGIGIAGFSERYRLVDGHMEIRFASDGKWIRQAPSEWAHVESWIAEAGRLRAQLAKARAIIELFESQPSRSEPWPTCESTYRDGKHRCGFIAGHVGPHRESGGIGIDWFDRWADQPSLTEKAE